jgi:hypothetical protein
VTSRDYRPIKNRENDEKWIKINKKNRRFLSYKAGIRH